MSNLERATEQLYRALEAYEEPDDLWIHPWDVDLIEPYWRDIQGQPLRRLTGFDLRWLADDILLVCGSVEALKYYLPRMLELLGREKLGVSPSTVLSKLAKAEWRTWPDVESEAVEGWLDAWWFESLDPTDVPEQVRALELERRLVALGCAETSDRWTDRYLNALHPAEHPDRVVTCAELICYRLGEQGTYAWPWAAGFSEACVEAYRRWLRRPDLRDALEAVYLRDIDCGALEPNELDRIADAVELLEIFDSLSDVSST